MDREESMVGELFKPYTVKTAMRWGNSSTSAIPSVIDLKTRELIWLEIYREGFAADYLRIIACVRTELLSFGTRMINGELLALWDQADHVEAVLNVNAKVKENMDWTWDLFMF